MTKNKIILLSSVVSMLYGFDVDAAFSRATARRAAAQQARLAQQNANSLPVQVSLTPQPAMPASVQPNVQAQQNDTPAQGEQAYKAIQTSLFNSHLQHIKQDLDTYTLENALKNINIFKNMILTTYAHPYDNFTLMPPIFFISSKDQQVIKNALNVLGLSNENASKFNLMITSLNNMADPANTEVFQIKPQ